MLMLEHDAKEALAAYGLPAPPGALVETADAAPPFDGPWMVKAQVPAGGRGKAGGIVRAETPADLRAGLSRLIGARIGGHPVRACRLEAPVEGAREIYLALMLDPASFCVRVLMSAEGGVDVEEGGGDSLLVGQAAPERQALDEEIARLAARMPGGLAAAAGEAGARLAHAFLGLEATLAEINPLFVLADGSWLAGDAKLIADANALPRQDALRALVERRAPAYPDVAFKLERGFDFVILDPDGEIGLVTTGAGLSMQLVDELRGQGVRPFNFCDIRTGQMRGDPARLVHVLGSIAQGPRIRAVLVNIFAGITDLNEFADLLLAALGSVPDLDVPIVARLVGNGEDAAEAKLTAGGRGLVLERDLDRAVAIAAGRERAEGSHG